MSGIGKKRAAEGRLDRDACESGEVATTETPAAPSSSSTTAAPVTIVKAGHRPEDAPSNNPFKGLATSTAGGAAASGGFGGLGGFGAAASGAPSFGGFGAFASSSSATSSAATTSSTTPAAPMKFSFSFGAPAASPAATPAAAPSTSSAPPAAQPATTTAPATTFSFNFGAASTSSAATTTASAPAATGGFNFGAKFDFNAGVKAFAAAQTAAAVISEKKPAEAEENVDPEAEDPAALAAVKAQPNALSAAAVKTDLSAGDESDETELEVPNTKVFLLGFKDVVSEDGKVTPSTTEKEWKERGVGTLKVNSFELDGVRRHRLLMHSSQTKQLVLNITVDKWFSVAATTEKAVNFRTVVVDAEGKPKASMYSLRVVETAVKGLSEKLKEITPKKAE